MTWVELHFHLLPGVDDGPRSPEESVALAVAAVRDGTRTVVATPHVNRDCIGDPAEIPERVRELAGRLTRERVRLEVRPGGELAHYMVQQLSDRQLEAIAQGPPGRRWVLLEAPFEGLGDSFTAAADELRDRGFAVVVAHPERAQATGGTAGALEHELSAGSALQLTCWSLAGLYGEQARRSALSLAGLPRVVIASDAHGGERLPAMRLGLDALSGAGHPDPSRLAESYPRLLLEHGLAVGSAHSPTQPLSGRA